LHEPEGNQNGGGKMSILLHVPAPVKKLVAKSKHVEPKTSSILLISVALFIAFIFVVNIGVLLPNTMNQYNTCRDRIVGYEQSGIYTNSELFKLALSYCGTS
jgi:hypothetical protein